MPMPQAVHIDRALTFFSVAYMAAGKQLSGRLFPVVPVNKQSDTFFIYDQGDFNRNDAGNRAPGTEPNYGDYDITSATPYFCKEWEKAKIVTDEEIADSDDPVQSMQDAAEFVSRKIMLARAVSFASSYFTTGVWTGGADKAGGTDFTAWSSPVSTPAANVAAWSDTVNDATNGHRPNTLAIGANVFTVLKNHPDVIERIKYTQKGINGDITPELLAGYFGVEQVLVGDLPVTTSDKGVTLANTQLYSGKLLLCYVPPGKVGLRTVAAGKTFAWNGGRGLGSDAMGMAIFRWYNNERRGTVIQGSGFWDHKVTAANAGLYASGVV